MSSHDFNIKFKEASDKLSETFKKVGDIQESMEQKLKLIDAEFKYANYCNALIKTYSPEKNICPLFNPLEGIYSLYGIDVIPTMIKSPVDIFNIQMSGLNTYYFRQDMKASINDIEKEEYLNLFKHDSLKSELFYKEFNIDTIKLTLEIADFSNILYPTRFNMIEISSFLKGSFALEKILIYPLTEELEKTDFPIEIVDFSVLGDNRIILDQKYHFYKIDFIFKLGYSFLNQDALYYPFALKHIYLYDADFTSNSFVIIPIHCDYDIAIVKDAIKIYSNRGIKTSTISEANIELYMQYENGLLSLPFNPSTTSQRYEIALNQQTVYAKIPINKPMNYIQFYVESRIIDEAIDKEKLMDLVCECILQDYKKEDYIESYWNQYEEALMMAKSALRSDTNQNSVDNAVICLSNALTNFK